MTISDEFRKRSDSTLKSTQASVAEIRACAELFAVAGRLRPRLNGMLRWDGLDLDARNLVGDFMGARDSNDRVVYGALLVTSYGLFEQYVRDLVSRAVETIESTCRDYSQLPAELTTENVYRTGIALQAIRRPAAYRPYDHQQLITNLSTCVAGGSRYVLNAECLSSAHGILNSDNLDQLFLRVGISLDWDSFGRDRDLKQLLAQPRTRDCTKALRAFIDEYTRKRNRISHSGAHDAAPLLLDLQQSLAVLDCFSALLVNELAVQLQKNFGGAATKR